jgi:hypothetical protein
LDVINLSQLLIGTAGLAAAFVIYRWQRQSKGLGYAVLTNRSLLTVRSPFAISVHHNGNVVREPRLCVMRVANTGNVPIQVADFERSVTFTFPQCEVLSVEVSGVRPDDLTVTLRVDGPTVTIEPCLLNPADVVEIQCLLDGDLVEPRVECRIVGVQSVRRVELARDSWGKVWRVSTSEFIVTNLATILLAGIAVWVFTNRKDSGISLGVGSVVALAAVLTCWHSISNFRRSRLWLTLPPPSGH